MSKYDQLREEALSNFELLLTYWDIEYHKVNEKEYDFLNPLREDNNHGACRFNIDKGTGADFAGTNLKNDDFLRLGPGFTAEDFANVTKQGQWGFDIIGLCQRLKGATNYQNAAGVLRNDLKQIKLSPLFVKPSKDASECRKHTQSAQKLKILKSAEKTWNLAKNFEGTLADRYFRSRKIYIKDQINIKYHPRVFNSELNAFLPAVLFRVQENYEGPLVAIHRIYISKDGSRKAQLNDPKKALGAFQSAGIWFGAPGESLAVVEGPENALSVLSIGYSFVVCTISASNFSNLKLADTIREVILFPDPDQAGKENALKAVTTYQKQNKVVKVTFPPKKILEDGKYADWNDIIMGRGKDG